MRQILYGLLAGLLGLIMWRQLLPGGFILYQGIIMGAAAAVVLYLWKKQWRDSALVFFIFYAFVFTIPTTVDRAYSVHMLIAMGHSPEAMSLQDIGDNYQQYFHQQGGIARRLQEQKATGSIMEKDGRYQLTSFGHFLVWAFETTQNIFAIEGPAAKAQK